MKFLHKLLVFALLFVGVITQASAETFTVNGVVYRITNTGVAVNNLAADNDLNGIVYVPEEVQYGSTTYKVTGIDQFRNKEIREISLPGTIEKITNGTFVNCKTCRLSSLVLASAMSVTKCSTTAQHSRIFHCQTHCSTLAPLLSVDVQALNQYNCPNHLTAWGIMCF